MQLLCNREKNERTGKPHLSTSSSKHQADVRMRWEREERNRRWCETGWVKERCVTVWCVEVWVCQRVACESIVCDRVVCKELCVCVTKLSVKELCVTKLFVKELFGTKLCVKEMRDKVVCERVA